MDWMTGKLQREAADKRALLDRLNAAIARTEEMLSEALAFAGFYGDRLAEIDRELGKVVPLFDAQFAHQVRFPTDAQRQREEALRAQREVVEREMAAERAKRTTVSTDTAGLELRFCELDISHVTGRRDRLVMARDEVQRELADIEGKLTPGQLVQSGVPAAEYLEHRSRVESLRERVGGAA